MTRGDFPLSAVHGDWAKLEAAGIPLPKSEVDGTHDGTSDDWNEPSCRKSRAGRRPSAAVAPAIGEPRHGRATASAAARFSPLPYPSVPLHSGPP